MTTKGHTVVKTNRRRERRGAERPAVKPVVTVVDLGNGAIRIVNCAAAAKWAGVLQQSFASVVRRHYNQPKNPKSTFKSVESRVKEAYPELFAAAK